LARTVAVWEVAFRPVLWWIGEGLLTIASFGVTEYKDAH
jgi:hypothetical protein